MLVIQDIWVELKIEEIQERRTLKVLIFLNKFLNAVIVLTVFPFGFAENIGKAEKSEEDPLPKHPALSSTKIATPVIDVVP